MKKAKRVFLIVLDSFGIGEAPDAAEFGIVADGGDVGGDTLGSVASSPAFNAPNLTRLGLFNIDGQASKIPGGVLPAHFDGAVARLSELSRGKDTTIGHWEIAGVISPTPMPTFPGGFPDELIREFEKETGRSVLCNKPYSGTAVIHDYGEEHLRTGDLIVYTSADSVFQIAAHEDIVPPEKLYEYCRIARRLLTGIYAVGRVIARPFEGKFPNFVRTPRRHDFSLEPPAKTLIDAVSDAGLDALGVGKIHDIFAGRGLTDFVYAEDNADGMKKTSAYAARDFHGLCFVNLVDTDSKFGHRRDPDGYANAISEFDSWLGGFLPTLGEDDVVMITADHGCDPRFMKTTDHTREYIPLIIAGRDIEPQNLGTRAGFDNIAATVCDLLGVDFSTRSHGFAANLAVPPSELIKTARAAMDNAYVPYSHFTVGAALLCADGKVYPGCNIEAASYSPTNCAERTAFFKAVSEGERKFSAIAVCGGRDKNITGVFPPCGVCRQVMAEFCSPDEFLILLDTGRDGEYERYTLSELLPRTFTPADLER